LIEPNATDLSHFISYVYIFFQYQCNVRDGNVISVSCFDTIHNM